MKAADAWMLTMSVPVARRVLEAAREALAGFVRRPVAVREAAATIAAAAVLEMTGRAVRVPVLVMEAVAGLARKPAAVSVLAPVNAAVAGRTM